MLVLVAALFLAGGSALATPSPCMAESAYYCVAIRIDPARPDVRVLVLDDVTHAAVDLRDPTNLEFGYLRRFADATSGIRVERGAAIDVLHIGGGGFTFPRYLEANHPQARQVVLELDPRILEIAISELGYVPSERIDVRIGDARQTIRGLPSDSYDLVFGDAFGGLAVPWHLTTTAFLDEVARVLRPGGAYVANLIDYPPLRLLPSRGGDGRYPVSLRGSDQQPGDDQRLDRREPGARGGRVAARCGNRRVGNRDLGRGRAHRGARRTRGGQCVHRLGGDPDGRFRTRGPVALAGPLTGYRSGMPRDPNIPDAFDVYTMVLLRRPADAPQMPEHELDALQSRHLAYRAKLRSDGLLVANGPLGEQSDLSLRGLSIFSCGLDEARRLSDLDPSVQAGRLTYEVFEWWVAAGTLAFPGTAHAVGERRAMPDD